MLVTEKETKKITCSLAEVANAIREEAEQVASSQEEAEILATAAMVNFLTSTRPGIFKTVGKLRKAAIVSSLS